jgi:hypothetical protein
MMKAPTVEALDEANPYESPDQLAVGSIIAT